MEKVRKLATIPLLIIGVLIFGAWTPYNTNEPLRYADSPIMSAYAGETIYFTDRPTVEEKYTPNDCPNYQQLSSLTNSCGATAGAMIVGYYDKYFPNLIAGWDSYYSTGDYRFQDNTYVPKVMNELYTLMRTNVDDVGVSEDDFTSGLKKYVNNKGYNLQYQSLVSKNNFNYEDYKKAIDSGKVVALLTLPCDVYNISHSGNSDYVGAYALTGAHIMVAYGYVKYNYYNASGLFRTDTYLKVAVGKNPTTAYYKINPHHLQGAYVVNIS